MFFRNNPAAPGTFLAPTELIPDKGTPIVIADFNHDGLPDIAYIQGNAVFTNPSNITVSLNQQSAPGTFPFRVTSSSFSGYDVVDLKTADMNGDGFPDLVVRCAPSYNGNTPPSDDTWESLVFLADPAHPGQFLAPAVFTPPATMNSIAVQDLNHDGLPDVVVSGKGSYFSVYLGDPAHPGQSLAPQNTTAPGNLTYLYTVAVGDVDGDGFPMSSPPTGETRSSSSPAKATALSSRPLRCSKDSRRPPGELCNRPHRPRWRRPQRPRYHRVRPGHRSDFPAQHSGYCSNAADSH